MSTFVCTNYATKPDMLEKVIEFVRNKLLDLASESGAEQLNLAVNTDVSELVVYGYWQSRHQAEVFRDTIFDQIDDDIDFCLTGLPRRVVYDTI